MRCKEEDSEAYALAGDAAAKGEGLELSHAGVNRKSLSGSLFEFVAVWLCTQASRWV